MKGPRASGGRRDARAGDLVVGAESGNRGTRGGRERECENREHEVRMQWGAVRGAVGEEARMVCELVVQVCMPQWSDSSVANM